MELVCYVEQAPSEKWSWPAMLSKHPRDGELVCDVEQAPSEKGGWSVMLSKHPRMRGPLKNEPHAIGVCAQARQSRMRLSIHGVGSLSGERCENQRGDCKNKTNEPYKFQVPGAASPWPHSKKIAPPPPPQKGRPHSKPYPPQEFRASLFKAML